MELEKMAFHSHWRKMSFLRLFLPLILGVLLEYYIPSGIVFLLLGFFISFIALIFFNCISFQKTLRVYWVYGIVLQVLFIFFGRMLMHLHQDKPIMESGYDAKTNKNYLFIQVITDPVQRKSSFKCLAKIIWLVKDQTSHYQNEKVLIYFKNNLLSRHVTSNSWIITGKILEPIENFKAFDFDYKKYCRLRHIYSQLYLKENEYSIIERAETKSVLSILDSLRKKILVIIKQYVPSKSENSLLEALMVGFTDDLDPLLLKSYADSGVMHIIAISGLHLALICEFLQIILLTKTQNKSGRRIKLALMITCLWSYSLLSGASPSVIRAAGMFSLALFAKNILREITLYNLLAASAFLLLCYDPFWIFDTGFQLSYAAVLSLGLFSKPIRDLFPLANKILDALWNAASVSIAAQLLTTPLSIYYFHRFPTYFLIANLLAVPLSSIILAGGILLCAFNPIHPLAQFTGWLLGILIKTLNGIIDHLSSLPGAVVPNLSLSLPGIIVLYAVIFCFYHFLKRNKKLWLLAGLGILVTFLFIRLASRLTLS
ncbi:MAG TPA: ComEC/Rec2 family competence protein [Puia sp.]